MKDKKSILNEFIETINWDQPLEELKPKVCKLIEDNCENKFSKLKMLRAVNSMEDVLTLQRYTFNTLLKFEGKV